jgi:hypothetical protein
MYEGIIGALSARSYALGGGLTALSVSATIPACPSGSSRSVTAPSWFPRDVRWAVPRAARAAPSHAPCSPCARSRSSCPQAGPHRHRSSYRAARALRRERPLQNPRSAQTRARRKESRALADRVFENPAVLPDCGTGSRRAIRRLYPASRPRCCSAAARRPPPRRPGNIMRNWPVFSAAFPC